ncbi:MAG: iron-containing alcohol dehydrogenase [Betaproteobacteria bacterium]|nr:iron-containing alcohol dehydrogenase [Betaproteobacteria bacterium]
MNISPEHPLFFCSPTRLIVQAGGLQRIAPFCKQRGWKTAVIVTDRFFSEQTSWIQSLKQALEESGLRAVLCDLGAANPTTVLCDQASQSVLSELGDTPADGLIALGGGSNIDLAKGLSLTLAHRRPISDFIGHTNWPGRPLPLIAMPTTSGTGSEVTAGAIFIQPGSATKVAVMGNDLRPLMSVVDPELTLSCPPRVTADAGMDAITHAIESWITMNAKDFGAVNELDPAYSGRNPLTVMFARESVRIGFEHLLTAFREPNNLNARTGMCYCSLYAALSYASSGLHAVHGLAYALAGITDETHGRTNAVFLPYVMDHLATVRTAELAEIGKIAGSRKPDPIGQARDAAALTRDLIAELGMPTDLKGFGIREHQLDQIIRDGLNVSRLAKAFPIQPPNAAYAEIVRNAYHGTLSVPRQFGGADPRTASQQ